MRPLVLTPKFKRAFRKFVKRNADLQQRMMKFIKGESGCGVIITPIHTDRTEVICFEAIGGG